jgi:hypothetical protein
LNSLGEDCNSARHTRPITHIEEHPEVDTVPIIDIITETDRTSQVQVHHMAKSKFSEVIHERDEADDVDENNNSHQKLITHKMFRFKKQKLA